MGHHGDHEKQQRNDQGVQYEATGNKQQERSYGEGDMQVVFRRGDWKNWDEAIQWLQTRGEQDNELTPGETIALTEDLERLKDSGMEFTRDHKKVYEMARSGGNQRR